MSDLRHPNITSLRFVYTRIPVVVSVSLLNGMLMNFFLFISIYYSSFYLHILYTNEMLTHFTAKEISVFMNESKIASSAFLQFFAAASDISSLF